MKSMSKTSSTTPIESAWFSAVHSLSVKDLQALVTAHGNHLLGLQKRDPSDFEDVETSTEAKTLLGADTTGMTAVHIALIMGEPQDSSVSSNSPHSVLAAKRLEVLAYLIDASTTDQLRLRWGRGNTALHLASFLGETDIIKALLAKGLPTHLKNELAFAPIDVAHDDATSDAFRSLGPPLRGEHRRIHSTSSSASSSFKRTESNASVGSFAAEEPLSSILQSRITKQQRPVVQTVLPLSPSTSPLPPSQAPVEAEERPLTFTGKYIRPPPDEDSSSAPTKPGPPLAIPGEQEKRGTLKGPKRRVIGVDLTLFDDVLSDSGDAESILAVLPAADVSAKPVSTPAMEQLTTKSLVSKNPFVQREKASPSSTSPAHSPIKPLSFRAASPASPVKHAAREMAEKEAQSPASGGSMLKMTANDNTSITSKKQTSLSHSTTTRQSRAPEIEVPTSTDAHEEVDRSAPDYNAIRATFAKMTVENPQVPKNPTERLAKVFAMAAVNGDPTRRKWKAASGDTSIVRNGEGTSVQGLDTLEPPKLAEASVPKLSLALTDAKRPHQKSDSGVEREGLPSVWSQAKEQGMAPPIGSKEEHEVVSELQEGSCDEAQEESKLVSVDSGLGVKDGDARATTDAVTIQQPVSTLAPPSLLLDLDLNLNFDDLESCLGFSDAIDSIPSTSATASLPVYSDDARQAAVAPATQFEKHAAVLVAASKLAEANQPPRTFDTTPIPRQPQSRYMDVSGLSHPSSPAQFGGVPMPSSPRRAPATVDNQDEFMASHTKSRTASAATNATVASVTTARSASPRGRKQVTFTPGAEPDNGGPSSVGTISAMGTTTPNPSRTSGIVTLKVSQIGGLEWVLAERQMCYVLVSVSKDSNAAPLFSSRPLLVLSDKVTLHEEASFDLNVSDRLFVEVKLRFERRQPAKSSIFSGFKLGKRDDQVKDVKEEMLAHHALNPIQILSQTAGSVETEEFLVASSKSTVTFTVSTMVMPLTLAAS